MIIPAHPSHGALLVEALSPEGIAELAQIYGMTVQESLRRNMAASVDAWTMLAGEDVLCMFGIAPISVMEKRGEFWILSTTHICRHRFAFARLCKLFLPLMLAGWDEVSCVLDHERPEVVRWAAWLGAKITPIDQRLSLMQLESR